MKFTVPASVTVSGWIEIEAPNLEAAKKICNDKNETGIDIGDLNDLEYHSVVETGEVEFQFEEDKPENIEATKQDYAAKRVGSIHAETVHHSGRSHCPTCGWVDELDRTNPIVLEWHGDSFLDEKG